MSTESQEDRREQARRRLGSRNPQCECGEADPLALEGAHPNIRCYEHSRIAKGLPPIEGQHPPGRANSQRTVPMRGNDHRVVDAMKADWPAETLKNSTGSPLLAAAACLRGWLDTLQLILDRTLYWVPIFLELLNAWLVNKIGDCWWDEFHGWSQP